MSIQRIHIIGGGTFSHVRNHLSNATPAFGSTARQLREMFASVAWEHYYTSLHLTKMEQFAREVY